MEITFCVMKAFCDYCSREVKRKQHQVSCTSCQAIIHKICTNFNSEKNRDLKNQLFPYMRLGCQSNTFPLSKQKNSDISLISSSLSNFPFSQNANIFPDVKLNSYFTECSSIETLFNDSDCPVSINSKYYDSNYFSKLNISWYFNVYKSSTFAALYLNSVALSKHLKFTKFIIIRILERKTNTNSMYYSARIYYSF